MEIRFDGTWPSWRAAARSALDAEQPPEVVAWRTHSDPQASLFATEPVVEATGAPSAASRSVPRAFVALAEDVACHSDPGRWALLYRVLWRLTHGEPHLLHVFVDDDVHALHQMWKAVRREGHKLRAFLRFRLVGAGSAHERYVAWFEPEHDVVRREAPFFARRFPSMRWSILTPATCAHWDGIAIAFSPGASRLDRPAGDVLEELWRTYYAHIFNPARVSTRAMRAEMPARYWKHLPEAPLIAPLVREAPARVRAMLAQQPSSRPPVASTEPTLGPSREHMAATPHDEGVEAARERSARARRILAARGVGAYESPVPGARVQVGTASWTDPTMRAPGVFYPDAATDARTRLAYYASRFSLVEVDATYYALPSRRTAAAWVERTPEGFVFDVKAHALMTGHATETARLPADLREGLPAALRRRRQIRGADLSEELLAEVWRRFLDALEPLAAADRLGALLLQLPRHLVAGPEAERAIVRLRERAGGTLCAVEFRHASWLAGSGRCERTLSLLRELGFVFVMVDAPPGFATSMPRVAAVTSERLAIVRMHGRRTETWESPVAVTSERYRYLYDAAELGGWVPDILDVAQRAQGVHVVMNNCHANYGTSNADEISALLVEADLERRRMYREGRQSPAALV